MQDTKRIQIRDFPLDLKDRVDHLAVTLRTSMQATFAKVVEAGLPILERANSADTVAAPRKNARVRKR